MKHTKILYVICLHYQVSTICHCDNLKVTFLGDSRRQVWYSTNRLSCHNNCVLEAVKPDISLMLLTPSSLLEQGYSILSGGKSPLILNVIHASHMV